MPCAEWAWRGRFSVSLVLAALGFLLLQVVREPLSGAAAGSFCLHLAEEANLVRRAESQEAVVPGAEGWQASFNGRA